MLADPVAVTRLLGDLLDQRRSDPGPPARWAIPRIHLGLTHLDTVLAPRFERHGDDVVITAGTTPDSDAAGALRLDLTTTPIDTTTCELETAWVLELGVPLPRTAVRLMAPALDRTIAATVQRIMSRTEAAVLAATDD